MPLGTSLLLESLRNQTAYAIQQIRAKTQWKPGKDKSHLAKRIRLRHLSPETTMIEYDAIVQSVVIHPGAVVYLFEYDKTFYPTIVAPYKGQAWLVMFSMNGTLETAFPPDTPDTYFSDPQYHFMGHIDEFVT